MRYVSGQKRLRGGLGAHALPVALLTVTIGAIATSCHDSRAQEIGRLQNAFPSPEALARAVLVGIHERDREALERYLVTRTEHRELLWDALPERTYFSFDYVRLLNERNTRKAIARALERYGGLPLELVAIRFTGEPEIYRDFVFHRSTELQVRHRETGEVGTIPVLNVVLELDGGWKPMHYVE